LETNQSEVIHEQGQPKRKRSGCLSFLVDILETLILSLVLFVSINIISARIRVDGDSMLPTMVSGEYVVINRLSYRFGNPQPGDIIVFHYPRNPSEEYIKRVIGLPGDNVEVMNGMVYVNGQPLVENYLSVKTNYNGKWEVPAGQLFVLGDNRNNSSDSHDWGTVPMDYVVGKAVLVYWPPPSWGLINHVPLANAAR
jgi:signal peptidase I